LKRNITTTSGRRPLPDTKLVSYTLDSLEAGVVTISSEGTITSLNAVAESMLGCDAAGTVGTPYMKVFPEHDLTCRVAEMVANALETGATCSSEEAAICTSEGRIVPIGMTISQLSDEHGVSLGLVLIFKNLEQVKQVREQILRTEQMASLGYLAAGIAHELRNPLGSLHGLAELLQQDFKPGDKRYFYTTTFIREIERLNKLVEDLLSFSQPSIKTCRRQPLNDVVRECMLFASYEFAGRPVSVCIEYGEKMPDVLVDSERLSRALLNILLNAHQASNPGDKITVITGMCDRSGQARCFAQINNNGSYIEPEVREQLFTPFFTTKKNGTGLGLSITRQIVRGHYGEVEVESDPDAGTTFTVILPPADSVAEHKNKTTTCLIPGEHRNERTGDQTT